MASGDLVRIYTNEREEGGREGGGKEGCILLKSPFDLLRMTLSTSSAIAVLPLPVGHTTALHRQRIREGGGKEGEEKGEEGGRDVGKEEFVYEKG